MSYAYRCSWETAFDEVEHKVRKACRAVDVKDWLSATTVLLDVVRLQNAMVLGAYMNVDYVPETRGNAASRAGGQS